MSYLKNLIITVLKLQPNTSLQTETQKNRHGIPNYDCRGQNVELQNFAIKKKPLDWAKTFIYSTTCVPLSPFLAHAPVDSVSRK